MEAYQNEMRALNAMDFDDLIILGVELLEEHDEVRQAIRNRFTHTMVDEFQDTNSLQMRLLRAIVGPPYNVCVVGDNAADMMAAVEAVGQGGHVLVRDGEVVARIPLALGGLMSEGTAEDVAAQHDDFMVKARAMGIEPPLEPIMGIIFLPLPVIPTLRIRPEGMFDVTTFTYAD